MCQVHADDVLCDRHAEDAHLSLGVELSCHFATDFHGLQPTAEGLPECALHHALEALLEPLEAHARSVRRSISRPEPLGRADTIRNPLRASGGIGRRAGFRCLCPQGRGGSSPPSPTTLSQVTVGADGGTRPAFYRTST